MRRNALTLALVALPALPAGAADQSVTFLPAIGGRAHYRVVRTMQTTNGPVSATTLAISEDARGTAADADLTDLLFGLNMALAATHGADLGAFRMGRDGSGRAGARSGHRGNHDDSDERHRSEFDFSGVADAGIATPSSPSPPRRGAAGRGRSSGGIGFPGGGSGGFPGGGRSGTRTVAGANGGMVTTVHIDGHAGGGHVNNVAITQTRSITVANLPFANVGSWSISVVK